MEVGVRVGTFLPTPTPPKIPSDSDSTALQRSPTDCGVPEYYREAPILRRSWPTGGCCAMEITIKWGEMGGACGTYGGD
jgi:hypothetical protein